MLQFLWIIDLMAQVDMEHLTMHKSIHFTVSRIVWDFESFVPLAVLMNNPLEYIILITSLAFTEK